MANKDFKIKNGLDMPSPLPVAMGGTGQTSTTNSLNALLPSQAGNANKVLSTDGTNTSFITLPVAYQRGGTASRPASPTAGDLYYNTDYNYFESYTGNDWFPIAAAPGIPTGVTATNQPSSRAFNNGQMSVAFTPNTSGGSASSFVVTPSPTTSPSTFSGGTSPITVTGLASSTQYTYTVTATSPYGTSSASSASTGVTATTVPAAPSLSGAAIDSTSASITITPGATGGSAITGYSIISSPTTTTQTTSSSPYTFTGLTEGTAYTFTATATNSNGTSAASSASNSVTPSALGDFEAIANATGTGSSTIISLTSIPQGYKSLMLRGTTQQNHGNNDYGNFGLRLNGVQDTNYTAHHLRAYADPNENKQIVNTASGTYTYGFAGVARLINTGSETGVGFAVFDIPNYTSNTQTKTVRCLSGMAWSSSSKGLVELGTSTNSGITDAITSIDIFSSNSNWTTKTMFTLYGIKG